MAPRPATKRPGGPDTNAIELLSSVVQDQLGLLTAQRDILTRVEQLMIALVQAQLDNGGTKATGSTVMTFARQSDPASCAGS